MKWVLLGNAGKKPSVSLTPFNVCGKCLAVTFHMPWPLPPLLLLHKRNLSLYMVDNTLIMEFHFFVLPSSGKRSPLANVPEFFPKCCSSPRSRRDTVRRHSARCRLIIHHTEWMYYYAATKDGVCGQTGGAWSEVASRVTNNRTFLNYDHLVEV